MDCERSLDILDAGLQVRFLAELFLVILLSTNSQPPLASMTHCGGTRLSTRSVYVMRPCVIAKK
jgi:hypothetical protein